MIKIFSEYPSPYYYYIHRKKFKILVKSAELQITITNEKLNTYSISKTIKLIITKFYSLQECLLFVCLFSAPYPPLA